MGAADGDGHAPDAYCQWIARNKARAVQGLNRNPFVKAQLAQPSPVTFGHRGPVDRADRCFLVEGEVGECHLRAIISIVWRLPVGDGVELIALLR